MSDEEIVQAVINGDEAVIARVMQKYSKLLWNVAAAILTDAASEQDIEECVADTFIYFWQNPEKYDEQRGKLKSWLALVTRSKAIDRYRAVVKRRETDLDEKLAARTDFFGSIIGDEERKRIRSCIDKLDELEREIVLRRFYYEQKPAEIALAVGIGRKQVENHLYQAKRKLKNLLCQGNY